MSEQDRKQHKTYLFIIIYNIYIYISFFLILFFDVCVWVGEWEVECSIVAGVEG